MSNRTINKTKVGRTAAGDACDTLLAKWPVFFKQHMDHLPGFSSAGLKFGFSIAHHENVVSVPNFQEYGYDTYFSENFLLYNSSCVCQ